MDPLQLIAPGKNNKQNPLTGTQMHMRIAEIRDNVLILKNGGLRSILKASSINFNLKSEDEQNAIIHSYQNFLNSLDFPIQIIVRSKKLDLDDYIEQIRDLADKQPNPLLQEQTYDYATYIEKLIEYADIMEKEFFVVIPFDPIRAQINNPFQKFFQRLAPKDTYAEIKRRRQEFNNLKKSLNQRVTVVKSGLENCGLQIEELNTKSIIELFYKIYNPGISRNQKIKNLDDTTIEEDVNNPQKQ